MVFARLGLETAQIPHVDRHGFIWLERGHLFVKDGTLRFLSAGTDGLEAGAYDIPYQTVSMIMLGPGTSMTHDVFRLAGRHHVGLVAVGQGGVRCYTAPPLGPDRSGLARRQVTLWADPEKRMEVALAMYRIRFGSDELPATKIEELRGIEGARVRAEYRILAQQYGVSWSRRRYDRQNPAKTDLVNMAVNHSATAVYAAADVAIAAVSAIPQLGFVHARSAHAFALDIADLFRRTVTIPVAFQALKADQQDQRLGLERQVRLLAGITFQKERLIASMIDRIKELLSDEGIKDDEECL